MATTTIDKLLVEISANADLLRAEIRRAGGDMKGFEQQTAGSAKAVGNLQERYARAALGVASATEAIARQGRVTGESVKQVLTHGANMVAMFGIGGPIVGAVAIAGVAIVQLFNRTSEEAKKTEEILARLDEARRRQGKSEVDQAREEIDAADRRVKELQEKLARQERTLPSGIHAGGRAAALGATASEIQRQEANASQARINLSQALGRERDREIEQLGRLLLIGRATNSERDRATQLEAELRSELASTNATDEQGKARRLKLEEQLEQLRAREKRDTASGLKSAEQAEKTADALQGVKLELQSIQASGASDPIATINARFDKLAEKLDQLGRDAPEAREEVSRLREDLEATRAAQIAVARQEIFTNAQRAGIEAVGSALEVARLQLQQSLEELRKKGTSPAVVEEAERLGNQLLNASEFARSLSDRLNALGEARLAPLKRITELSKERQEAEEKLATITGDSVRADEARAVIKAQIQRIDGDIVELQDENTSHLQAQNTAAEGVKVSLSGALNVAFGMASALRGGEASLTRMIGATAQIVAGFEQITELQKTAAEAGQALSLLSALPAVGSIVGGAVAIGGLLGIGKGGGETPEARAQREATERLTRALDELRTEVGDLGRLPISGDDAASLLRVVLRTGPGVQPETPTFGVQRPVKEIIDEFRRLGVTFGDLKRLASEFNLELSEQPTFEQLEALQAALRDLDRAIFPDSFQGRIAEMEATLRAIGESDPLKQLIARIEVLTGPEGAPALAEALKDLDLGSAAGRKEAIARLQELLKNVSNLENTDFGGLLPKEFVDELLGMIEGLRAIDPGPLEVFADNLAILRQRFEVEGTKAADKVAAIIDLFATSFEELAFLKDGGSATSIDEVKERFKAVFDAAAADGVIDEKENAILHAFRELLSAMAAVAEEASEAARREAEATEDNQIRRLRADGRDAEADALERQLANEKELQALREAGVSEAIIQERAYVQALEEAAQAAAAAAAAQAKAVAAERERIAFLEEIETQLRRARGDNQGADEFELEIRQRERRERAKTIELSEEQLKKLEELEALERAQLAARFKGETPESGGARGAGALPDRQTGVQTITERSTFEVIDVLRSIHLDHGARLTEIRDLLGARVSAIPVPAFTPGSFAASRVAEMIFSQTNNFYISGTDLSRDELVDTMRAQLVPHMRADVREINRQLGLQMRQDLRGRGRGEVP